MARRMSEQWNSVVEEFEMWYPNIAEKVVDWYPSARFEITVKTSDDEMFIFDWLEKSITRIDTIDSEQYTDRDVSIMFSNKLRSKIMHKCMSMDELSELSGISRMTLSKYINAKSVPNLHNIHALSRALDCSVSELTDIIP